MSHPAPPPVAPESVLVFRATLTQRRGPAIAALVFAVIAAILLITAVARHDGWGGNFTVYAFVTAFLALVLLLLTVAGSRGVTECRPDGLHTRRFRTHDCAWSQITDIKQDTFSGRSTDYFVVVSTASGQRFKLGVPTSSTTYQNPEFDTQVAQITAYWHAATGRTASE